MANCKSIKAELASLSDAKQAKLLSGFFKTGRGEYGEGDKFIGVKVPLQRRVVAANYRNISLSECVKLLSSPIHEHRLTALLILVRRFERGDDKEKQTIFSLYLKNIRFVNNWDLVDLSAPNILGSHLLLRSRKLLYRLAKSNSLWERRIAIISTAAFIREYQFQDTLIMSKSLLEDKHDLIHKACGWMLREVGKRDIRTLEKFLNANAHHIPRTMLRYSIERFPKAKRIRYLDVGKKRK